MHQYRIQGLPPQAESDRCAPRFSRYATSNTIAVEGQGGPKATPIARDPAISLRLKGLVLVLEDFAGTDDHCWPSQATLERATGLSKRNLCHALKDAEDAGLISRVKDEGRRARVGILLLRRSRATLPAAVDLGAPDESALRSRRASKTTPKPGDTDGRASKATPSCASIPTPACASKTTRRLTGSDNVQETPSVTGGNDNDVSSRILPDPGPIPTVDAILSLTTGADPALLDRAAHQVLVDLGDDPARISLHRQNLTRASRGDRVELLRILVSLLAGRRARMRGQVGGREFAKSYMGFFPPDPTQTEAAITQAVEGLRALDATAAAAQAAVASRARLQAEERQERAAADLRRAEKRKALSTLALPPGATPAEILTVLGSVGVGLTARRLPGLRPALILDGDLGFSDLPSGVRDALERHRSGIADLLDPLID